VKVVVSGASGLVGWHLLAHLSGQGHDVVAVLRQSPSTGDTHSVAWNSDGSLPASAVVGADAIVNLAGASIGTKRWTASRRRELVSSRVDTTRACVRALGQGGPTVLVNASAVGIYGPTTTEVDERSPVGTGFLADLCDQWEQTANEGLPPSTRAVSLRFGVILARGGGALTPLVRLANAGLNGPLGNGQQWLPWVHVDDAVRVIEQSLTAAEPSAINVVAPQAVTQREFARTLGRVLHRPALVRTPAAAVQIALGRGAASVILTGQRVAPSVLASRDFAFGFGQLDAALSDLTTPVPK
jgi:uncharacterized protein